MPKRATELTDKALKNKQHPGPPRTSALMVAVGGEKVRGLYLQITASGARSWVLRTMVNGKRREMGLGPYPEVSLGEARATAIEQRKLARESVDPIEARRQKRQAAIAEQNNSIPFEKAVERYLASKGAEFRSDKHRKQWRSTLDTYAQPVIGKMMVASILMDDILRVLEPIWTTKTETASRLRQRIEKVLDWATARNYRAGENPARWRGNLQSQLATPSKVARKDHHPAVAIKEAPAWFEALRQRDGTAARALEFAALTAARSGEVRGMTWDEVDHEEKLWTIPASRMKADKEHDVPLTDAALAIIDAMPRIEGSEFVFAAPRGGALSDMALSAVMRRMQESEEKAGRKGWLDPRSGRPAVPHGLRSTFRDWAGEKTDHKREVIEHALAHRLKDKAEASYARSTLLEKRRPLMVDWSRWIIDAA